MSCVAEADAAVMPLKLHGISSIISTATSLHPLSEIASCLWLSSLFWWCLCSLFVLFLTYLNEVKEVFRDIKNKKSTKDDGTSVEVLLWLRYGALNVLDCAINNSLSRGEFLACLKEALVIPQPSNFHPISLLLMLSKIFEKNCK